MLKTSKAFSKTACVLSGVAEGQPDNLSILVSERTFCDLPYAISNCGCLIKNEYNSLALVMQTSKGFCVVLAPRHEVRAPRLFMVRVPDRDAGCFGRPPVGIYAPPKPTMRFWYGLSSQLCACVRSNQHHAILMSGHGPVNNHRNKSGLSDAMAARYCDLAGCESGSSGSQVISNGIQYTPLPLTRAVTVCQLSFFPGIGVFDELGGIVAEGCEVVDELFFEASFSLGIHLLCGIGNGPR